MALNSFKCYYLVSLRFKGLIVARMDSLKDRREMLMARLFTKQVLASNALPHCLLPEPRDNDTIRSLRNSQPFPSIRARTTKVHKSFLPYCLKDFTGALWFCTAFYCFNVSCIVLFYCAIWSHDHGLNKATTTTTTTTIQHWAATYSYLYMQ